MEYISNSNIYMDHILNGWESVANDVLCHLHQSLYWFAAVGRAVPLPTMMQSASNFSRVHL